LYWRIRLKRPSWRFILIRQYKHGVGDVSLTLPGGALNEGEDPLTAAKRELLEETGHEVPSWRPIVHFVTHANQRCSAGHMFFAEGAVEVAPPDSGDLEEMELVYLAEPELRRAMLHNEVRLSSALAALGMVLAGIVPPRS
jgi:ADP-ribose pyrophosphatase